MVLRLRLSYFGFDKFDQASTARDKFQIFYEQDNSSSWSDAKLRGSFDTLQLFNSDGTVNARVPFEFGDKGANLEPFTQAYPDYGSGGIRQLVPVTRGTIIQFFDLEIIKE